MHTEKITTKRAIFSKNKNTRTTPYQIRFNFDSLLLRPNVVLSAGRNYKFY